MVLKTDEHSIDLKQCNYRNYSWKETSDFKRVRAEYGEKSLPVLEGLAAHPEWMPLDDVDYPKLIQLAKDVQELQQAEQWLAQKHEEISESLRDALSQLKEGIDPLVEVARPLTKHKSEMADLFADLFDFIAEPRKKAAATRRRKQEKKEEG